MLYKDNGLAFEYSFDSDAASSYLVVSPACELKLQNNQAEIISHNPSTAFVPFNIRRENDKVLIYYNITSRISLSQYLERKRLNRKELLDLLGGIARNLMLHCNYLLDLSSFVIDTGFIFINPATTEISLVYIPVECYRCSLEVCRMFLRDLVVNSANVDDDAKDNYMQRILSYLKSDTFSLNDFNRLVVDMRYNEGQNEAAAAASKELTTVSSNVPVVRNIEKKPAENSTKSKGFLKILLIQLLIVMPASIVYLFILSRGIADPVSAAGIFIIFAAVDFLIMKRQLGNPVKRKETSKPAARLPKNMHEIIPQEASRAAEPVKICDTVMISERATNDYPYLEGITGQSIERILLNKDKFVIGRLGSMVDHTILDGTIGKLHAEISCREGCYFITDLNSKNGTYINDVRITSNKEHEIKDNYKIRFSSYEYVFRQKALKLQTM